MILDKQNTFSTAQAVTSSAASTDYIDLGAVRDVGMSDDLYVAVTVGTAADAVGSATVTIALQGDTDSGFATALETLASTAAIGKATLAAGYQLFIPIPPGYVKRYLRMYYTVATGPLTAGTFSAAIVSGIQKNRAYADAI